MQMASDVVKTKAILEKQLNQIENQIQELKNRLPAHSIKPIMMRELLELEDQRDTILAQIQTAAKPATDKDRRKTCN